VIEIADRRRDLLKRASFPGFDFDAAGYWAGIAPRQLFLPIATIIFAG
jgi:hypothetical protein